MRRDEYQVTLNFVGASSEQVTEIVDFARAYFPEIRDVRFELYALED